MIEYLLTALLLPLLAATTVPSSHEETIPEFFDDNQNVYCLIVGFAIILLCLIIAIVIFKVKSKSSAFENSLFQNL
jgi:hypothetical protein